MKVISYATIAAVLISICTPAPAIAGESYDNCTGFVDSLPATINTQGTWCLRDNLSTGISAGNAITVGTNNVTLDCNNFKVGGLAAGVATTAVGINSQSRFNTTVRNCQVRGFQTGVFIASGGGHVVENSSFDGNTFRGIYLVSSGSMIRGNLVVDTGGSTNIPDEARGIYAGGGVDVIDNTVNGVAAIDANSTGYGIFTQSNGEGSVVGNRVRGVVSSGTGAAYGIWNNNSGRSVIRGNIVQGLGAAFGSGIRCTSNQATSRDNVVVGFPSGVLNCVTFEDVFNVN